MKNVLLFSISMFLCFTIFGQEDSTKQREYVRQTFRGTDLYFIPTSEITPKHSFDFNIQHRFGKADLANDLLKNFFGMDLISNIRFEFLIPLSSRLHIGIGRTKTDKVYDFKAKYLILKQTKDYSIPLSLALQTDIALMSDKFPDIDTNFRDSDGGIFEYKFVHRLSYSTNLILTHKINNTFSIVLSPTFIHRNLTDTLHKNDIFILPFGGKITLGLRANILFELGLMFDKNDDVYYPMSLAFEMSTASHIFQIGINNSNHILEQYQYTKSTSNIFDGQFFLGFNIIRRFYIKKR